MLDKLITYIVCWYKTLYQVLPVAWTNRITTRRESLLRLVVILVHTTGSTWYKVLYHHTMYVMGIYYKEYETLAKFWLSWLGPLVSLLPKKLWIIWLSSA
jgi:hypothetical protein